MTSVTTDRNHFAPRRHNYDDIIIIIIIVIDDIQRYSLICTSSQCFGREGGGGRKEKKDVASSSSAAFSLSVVHNQNTWFSRQTKYIWYIHIYIYSARSAPNDPSE